MAEVLSGIEKLKGKVGVGWEPREYQVITVVFKISNLRERKGQMGRMAFMTFDSTYKNQEQELVAKCRQMVIGY